MPRVRPALIAILVAAMAGGAAIAQAPNAAVPRTADGKPDMTGIWTNASLTSLERPRGVSSLVVGEAEAVKLAAATSLAGIPADDPDFDRNARYSDPTKGAPEKGGADFGLKGYDAFWVAPGDRLSKVKGEFRTSDIVEPANGQLPHKDPAAVARAQMVGFTRYMTGNDPYEGPEATTISERCLIGFGGTGGPGMLSVLYNNNYQFVQTPNHMMILVEMAHDARVIPIFSDAATARAGHKPANLSPWLGDSVGWWEGDTFVIETINVNPLQREQNSFPLSGKGKVTERLTRTSDKDIFYEFAIDDPENYTQPWRAESSFYPSTQVYEYACHEGNYGLEGILAGARNKERQAAAK